jgi:hypothetical protein
VGRRKRKRTPSKEPQNEEHGQQKASSPTLQSSSLMKQSKSSHLDASIPFTKRRRVQRKAIISQGTDAGNKEPFSDASVPVLCPFVWWSFTYFSGMTE